MWRYACVFMGDDGGGWQKSLLQPFLGLGKWRRGRLLILFDLFSGSVHVCRVFLRTDEGGHNMPYARTVDIRPFIQQLKLGVAIMLLVTSEQLALAAPCGPCVKGVPAVVCCTGDYLIGNAILYV